MSRTLNRPLGPNNSWKTGQRVPFSGNYRDQHGQVNWFQAHRTFPPVVASKGGDCAYRHFLGAARETA